MYIVNKNIRKLLKKRTEIYNKKKKIFEYKDK